MTAAALNAVGPRDQAARPLHRGDADPGARGARDRPPVDVRLDHRHDPQPRLRLQEGHRAGAGLAGVLGRPAARGALPAAGRLRVHRRHGGRPRRDRRRPEGPQHRAGGVLLRHRRRRGPEEAGHRARRDRRPRAGDVPGRADAASTCGSARYGPYVEAPATTAHRRQARQRARRPAARRADRWRRRRSCWPTRPARRPSSARTRRPGNRSSPRTAATAPTSPRCSPRTRRQGAKPRTGSLFKSMSLDTITLDTR